MDRMTDPLARWLGMGPEQARPAAGPGSLMRASGTVRAGRAEPQRPPPSSSCSATAMERARRATAATRVRLPLATLAGPGHRLLAGNGGPAFQLLGMVVWGITAELPDAVLRVGGWSRPWPPGVPRELAEVWRDALGVRR